MNEPRNAPGFVVQGQVYEGYELGDARVEVLEVDEATNDGREGDGEEQRIIQLGVRVLKRCQGLLGVQLKR